MALDFAGRALIAGQAAGPILFADLGLSFWGGVHAATGEVIDSRHPLRGRSVAGAVLAIPSGRGSCTGSAVLLELIVAGKAPAALIFREEETILPLGALVAQALFGRSLPMMRLDAASFAALESGRHAQVRDGRVVCDGEGDPGPRPAVAEAEHDVAPTAEDRAMLAGEQGPARRMAMEIVLAMARLQRADGLIDVVQAHLDCCIHTGPVSVAIAERLRDLGAQVKVPTTMNAISIDRRGWRAQGVPPEQAEAVRRQTDAYVAMGAMPTFTCAPYLLDSAPLAGEQIGWAESNAVAFANSVIGARTDKYADYMDLCVALTGRTPASGCHDPANRKARAHIAVEPPSRADDALFPMLGYLAGELSPSAIPLLTGLEGSRPTRDDLKAFAAAFATTSAAPMFHIAGVTPEAIADKAVLEEAAAGTFRIGAEELRVLWRKLNGEDETAVGCIAIGNPHASFEEMAAIAGLCAGRSLSPGVAAIVATGRAMHERAAASGVVAALEAFGFRLILDTCWCMIEEPVLPPGDGCLLTNSGKYAHYGPGLTGRRVRFAGLAACIEAAATGRYDGAPPAWLRGG